MPLAELPGKIRSSSHIPLRFKRSQALGLLRTRQKIIQALTDLWPDGSGSSSLTSLQHLFPSSGGPTAEMVDCPVFLGSFQLLPQPSGLFFLLLLCFRPGEPNSGSVSDLQSSQPGCEPISVLSSLLRVLPGLRVCPVLVFKKISIPVVKEPPAASSTQPHSAAPPSFQPPSTHYTLPTTPQLIGMAGAEQDRAKELLLFCAGAEPLGKYF